MTTDLSFTLRYPETCTEGVNRGDQYEPCDRPAVAIRLDVENGTYPVCAQHSRARMVPLAEVTTAIEAKVRAQIAADVTVVAVAIVTDMDMAGAELAAHRLLRDFADGCGDPACTICGDS